MAVDIAALSKQCSIFFSQEEYAKWEQELAKLIAILDTLPPLPSKPENKEYDLRKNSVMQLRADEIQPSLTIDAALQNAPKVENNHFVTLQTTE